MSTISLLVASTDEHFREMVRENLLNMPNAKVVAEYPEVTLNLYIRVLQDLERQPEAALFVDLAGDPEASLKALEKVKQAAPDLYVIAANYAGDAETVIHAVRSGANDFILLPLRRTDFRDAIARLEHVPRRAVTGGSRLGRVYTFLGAKGGVGTTTLAVNFAGVLAQRKQNTVLLDLDWTANDVAMQLGAARRSTRSGKSPRTSAAWTRRCSKASSRATRSASSSSARPTRSCPRATSSAPCFASFHVPRREVRQHRDRRRARHQQRTRPDGAAGLDHGLSGHHAGVPGHPQRAALPRLARALGFTVDQVKVLVNHYTKKPGQHYATLEQIQQTLNQPVFYGIPQSPAVLAAINRGRPFVEDRQAAGELDRVFRAFVDKATGRKKEETAKSA